jgi:hypothetical protein
MLIDFLLKHRKYLRMKHFFCESRLKLSKVLRLNYAVKGVLRVQGRGDEGIEYTDRSKYKYKKWHFIISVC